MKKDKKKTIDSLKINSKDVGSSEVQIGLLSEKINNLSDHFKRNKNDKHSTRGLLKAVNLRKRLLEYLKNNNSMIGSLIQNNGFKTGNNFNVTIPEEILQKIHQVDSDITSSSYYDIHFYYPNHKYNHSENQ